MGLYCSATSQQNATNDEGFPIRKMVCSARPPVAPNELAPVGKMTNFRYTQEINFDLTSLRWPIYRLCIINVLSRHIFPPVYTTATTTNRSNGFFYDLWIGQSVLMQFVSGLDPELMQHQNITHRQSCQRNKNIIVAAITEGERGWLTQRDLSSIKHWASPYLRCVRNSWSFLSICYGPCV